MIWFEGKEVSDAWILVTCITPTEATPTASTLRFKLAVNLASRVVGLTGKHCNLILTSAKRLGGKQLVYEPPDLATQ